MSLKRFFVPVVAAVALYGCTHETVSIGGKGGAATVVVYPQHHHEAKNLTDFKVYIKYNTLDAPVDNVYDDSALCTNHDDLVSCAFSGLKNGNYYFYGYGYDSTVPGNVKGGLPYTITQQASQNLDLPVSE